MPKTDKELTVEECLAELREIAPKAFFDFELLIRCNQQGKIKERGMINIGGHYFYGPSLADCVKQVRAYRNSQQ